MQMDRYVNQLKLGNEEIGKLIAGKITVKILFVCTYKELIE
jgi:hypothetical protein